MARELGQPVADHGDAGGGGDSAACQADGVVAEKQCGTKPFFAEFLKCRHVGSTSKRGRAHYGIASAPSNLLRRSYRRVHNASAVSWRALRGIPFEETASRSLDRAGAKAHLHFASASARLKSCPDTSCCSQEFPCSLRTWQSRRRSNLLQALEVLRHRRHLRI